MPTFQPFFDQTAAILSPDLRAAALAASYPGLMDEPHDAALAGCLKSPSMDLSPLAVSGLWLLAGDLERSHSLSQDDPSAEGSFWHGIMHRREGDYSNAKYWFRRVGAHPVLDELAKRHDGDFSNPFDFVDDVEKACRGRSGDPSITQSLLMIQWTEWQLLMQLCLCGQKLAGQNSGKPS